MRYGEWFGLAVAGLIGGIVLALALAWYVLDTMLRAIFGIFGG